MLRALIAYDSSGNVVATLDHVIAKDEDGNVVGLIDFEAHEAAGGRLRDIWEQSNAVGSGTWPEWIGGRAYDFTVELDPHPGPARARIAALIHKGSGHRRVREDIEAAIERRHEAARAEAHQRGEAQRALLRKRKVAAEVIAEFTDPPPGPVDIRDIVGGPNAPLLLDDEGRTKARVKVARPVLPVVGRG